MITMEIRRSSRNEELEIEFLLNERSLGVAYSSSELGKGTYYPIMFMHEKGDIVGLEKGAIKS